MGRRKIEIKAIKDDRNRSVTFLKRKGGLFKKAHELAVLCSVDVAVIIFGHNKKLHEFSSTDVNEMIGRFQYYGGAHEHKGPEDFMGKKDGDDDDDDDEPVSPRPDSNSPPQQAMMPHHLQQAAFQHMGTPSQSPPMPNGAFHHRHPSPHPPHPLSRPGSRAHMRHPSQTVVQPPQQHMQVPQTQSQQQQPSYAYMPNPPIYNPQAAAGMQMRPQGGQPQPPQYQYSHQPPSQPPPPTSVPAQHQPVQSVQQPVYQQDQQRQPLPPTIQQPDQRPTSVPHAPTSQPQPPPQPQFHSPPMPQPKPLPNSQKHSIFTPIDDSRSLLAQHWGPSASSSSGTLEPPKSEPGLPPTSDGAPRSQSIDVASIKRNQLNGALVNGKHPHPGPTSNPPPQRTSSVPAVTSVPTIPPPTRTNSLQTDPKRPRLKVQIPSDNSDDDKQTADTSPQATAQTNLTPVDPGRVVLPPPSPSASALLSAGASGPPNPFARPAPPPTSSGFGRNDMETPISALPSRFVSDQLLPSPSGFYQEWGFGRDSNMLPSPLTFATPTAGTGPSFRDDDAERKRKISDGSEDATAKKIKV